MTDLIKQGIRAHRTDLASTRQALQSRKCPLREITIFLIALEADGVISESARRRERRTAAGKGVEHDSLPQRQTCSDQVSKEALRFQRRVRGQFPFSATSGRAFYHVFERFMGGKPAASTGAPFSKIRSDRWLGERFSEQTPWLPARTGHH